MNLKNDLKNYLDRLGRNLKKEDEPELLKAVNYALKEYPCMLRCLEDGSLDLSNNICERQIRRIAKSCQFLPSICLAVFG